MRTVRFYSPQSAANSHALLWPVRENAARLLERGLRVAIISDLSEACRETDVLFWDSKCFRGTNHDEILSQLDACRSRVGHLLWLDTTDGSGSTQFEVLPHVEAYYKSQVLKDRSRYGRPCYGNRIFSDYYHEKFGETDEEDAIPSVLLKEEDFSRVHFGWNSALGDWGQRAGVYRWFRDRLGFPRGRSARFTPASSRRTVDVACRMGRKYGKRGTVSLQRRRIGEILEKEFGMAVDPIPRGAYFAEMRAARVGVSPFGWGEIAYRDYELILSGAAVYKADMGHLETWPDLYVPDVSYVPFAWDFSDFTGRLRALLDSGEDRRIAATAQETYRTLLETEAGHQAFCDRLSAIVDRHQ